MWWKDSVRELWNRPRSSVQLKYGVFPALSEEERAMCRHLGTVLIRVVPPNFRSLVRGMKIWCFLFYGQNMSDLNPLHPAEAAESSIFWFYDNLIYKIKNEEKENFING